MSLCLASALGRAHHIVLQPLGAEEQRVRHHCSGQAWGMASQQHLNF